MLAECGKIGLTYRLNSEYFYICFDLDKLSFDKYEISKNTTLAIDMNPSYIGLCVINGLDNIIHKEVFDLSKIKTHSKRDYELIEIAKHISELCKHYKVELVGYEKLKIKSDDAGKGKRFNKQVNNDWHRERFVNSLHKWLGLINCKWVEILPEYSSYIGCIMYEDEVDDLCGWGGDLRQSVPIIMRDINYSNDYNTVYNATYNYIGNGKYFNMPDLLADIDAYNMDNMPYSMSIGDKLVDYYYNNGYIKRFTNFIGTQSYMDIYNRSKRILTMTELEWVWAMEKAGPDDKSTGESLVLTDNQIDAICAAYATYLMDQAKSE